MMAPWLRVGKEVGYRDHDHTNRPCRRGNPVHQLAGLQVIPAGRFDNFLDARGVRKVHP
jgi:hypothetical protein